MRNEDEPTPEHLYLNRRTLMKAGVLAATTVATGFVYRRLNAPSTRVARTKKLDLAGSDEATTEVAAATTAAGPGNSGFHVDEPMTSLQDITHYNNFYEFSTDKDGVADPAAKFNTDGWKITIDGLVSKPQTYDLDDVLKIARPEERVYRMRCVEAWSMVIPWAGFSLSKLLNHVRAD